MRRGALAAIVGVLALGIPSSALGATTNVFAGHTISGSGIPCTAQGDGVRVCHGTVGAVDQRLKSFDGTPLEVYVILPPAPSSGTDGNYPLIIQSHGWGGSAAGPSGNGYLGPTGDAWAKAGYAVLQLTARGFGSSCGTAASRAVAPTACANGYIRLDDERYEARDPQYAAGLLVDAGLVDPAKIGATGPSYGGGLSLELATLKDRVMNADGSFSPWKSPHGTPLSLTAAAPIIPWSDLAYSLMPNGRTLDYAVTGPTTDLSPIGVEKQSFVSGLYALGAATGYYAPPGLNSQADITSWFGLISGGEPYDTNPAAATIVAQIARYHSPYYLLDGAYGDQQEAPAPMLIANGFTDDLFPVDEALRYANLEQSLYPSDQVALFDGDFGHMRAQNKPGDVSQLSTQVQALFDHYLKGTGTAPSGVTATIETCPKSAPSGGPFSASTWSALHPGEVDFSSAAAQTVSSAAGDPTIGATLDPVAGPGACATASAADQGSGVATYRLPAAVGSGYTLLGSPTVIANLQSTGSFPELAERLWDVDPATGKETLVARGVYRLDPSRPNGTQVFQLHPGAWHFAAGHVAKLELLGNDKPYVRASNGTFSIAVSQLQLRLPVHEQPGSAPGVTTPLTPFGSCTPRPSSRLIKRRSHVRRRGAVIRGTASDTCAGITVVGAPKTTLKHVYVAIYRQLRHGRCQFLNRHGKLTRARSCKRVLELKANGTTRFTLRIKAAIPRGRYIVRSDAVDSRRRHQRRTKASRLRVRVR